MSTQTQTQLPPLRAVRQAQGFSLREVSRRASIDPAHLSRIERGEASPSIDTLARLAGVLGLRTLGSLLDQYRGTTTSAAPRAATKLDRGAAVEVGGAAA